MRLWRRVDLPASLADRLQHLIDTTGSGRIRAAGDTRRGLSAAGGNGLIFRASSDRGHTQQGPTGGFISCKSQ